MITIADGLYAHRAGTTLILSDEPHMTRTSAPAPKILIVAKDHAAFNSRLRRWLSSHQLDEIAAATNISRSAAHRLRAAMGIKPRGGYSK